MGRFVAGGGAALLLVAGGLFWWQGQANDAPLPPAPASTTSTSSLPEALPEGDDDQVGPALPMPSSATAQSREEKRFARYDRNRDGIVTRLEMLGSRVKAFKKLDADGNNLLSFEEWAVATSERFAGADSNRDGKLNASEFATTASKPKPKDKCKC